MDKSKNEEKITPDQTDLTDEKKDQDQTGDDTSQADSQQDVDESKTDDSEEQGTSDDSDKEEVTITKKELEALEKKRDDFDAMVKSKRIAKFSKKEKVDSTEDGDGDDIASSDIDENAILVKAKEIAEKTVSDVLMANNKEEFSKNLSEVYGSWLGKNSWADNDEITEQLAGHFTPTDSSKKEDILAALDKAALSAYPKSFMEAIKAQAKREVLADENSIDVGDAGASVSETKTKTAKHVSKEDRSIADRFFNGDVERYQKFKNN